MAGPKKTLEAVKRGGSNIAFGDLQRLMEELGFRLNRTAEVTTSPSIRVYRGL
jgi:hypothetical protein